MIEESYTEDIISDVLTLYQHRDGYRFGLDALLLVTDLPPIPRGGCAVDLGAAHGPVALSLASRRADLRVVAVERQAGLVGLLRRNISKNGFEERVRVVNGDVRRLKEMLPAHCADIVLCNPPYFPKGTRRVSPRAERAQALHELHGGLDDFLSAARYICGHRGWIKCVLPPFRFPDLLVWVEQTDLVLDALRCIHARSDEHAYLMELFLRRHPTRQGRTELRILAPLFVFELGNRHTQAAQHRIDDAARPEEEVES